MIILFLLPFIYISYQIILEAGELIKGVNLPELIEELLTNSVTIKILEKLSFITGGDIKSLEDMIKNEISGLLKEGALKVAHGFSNVMGFFINLILTFFYCFLLLEGRRSICKKNW